MIVLSFEIESSWELMILPTGVNESDLVRPEIMETEQSRRNDNKCVYAFLHF